MERKEIIEIFDNEKTKQGTMLRDDPTSFIDVWETDKLLEIVVTMKGGHQTTILYSDRKYFIDITSNHYVGLGNTLVSPIEDIEDIDVKWR